MKISLQLIYLIKNYKLIFALNHKYSYFSYIAILLIAFNLAKMNQSFFKINNFLIIFIK